MGTRAGPEESETEREEAPASSPSARPRTPCNPGPAIPVTPRWRWLPGAHTLLRGVGLESENAFETHLDVVITLSKSLGKDFRRRTFPGERPHEEMAARFRRN